MHRRWPGSRVAAVTDRRVDCGAIALKVDGREVPAGAFVVPDMHLSSGRDGLRRHTFEITCPLAFVVDQLRPAYAIFIEEARIDFLNHGETDELADAGFPPIDRLHEAPEALAAVIGNHLKEEFLQRHSWDGSQAGQYWFDEVLSCRVSGADLVIAGTCYARPEGRPTDAPL